MDEIHIFNFLVIPGSEDVPCSFGHLKSHFEEIFDCDKFHKLNHQLSLPNCANHQLGALL